MTRVKLPISAFAINYNGWEYLEGCLQSLSFCEQLILVDKGSSDNSVSLAKKYTSEIYQVEWSPIVEHTRPFALEKCHHEWVLFLDHDEMIDIELMKWIEGFIRRDDDSYDAVALSRKDHYFGDWSEQQRSWPARHIRLFRKSKGRFEPRIHTSAKIDSNRIYEHQTNDGGAIIHHAYDTLEQWSSTANRYTSTTEWETAPFKTGDELFDYIDTYLNNAKAEFKRKGGGSYEAVTHTLFFMYNLLDELKKWESHRNKNVNAIFMAQRNQLAIEISDLLKDTNQLL